jgi:hypothetical protein
MTDEKAAKEYAEQHEHLHGVVHKKRPSMYGDAHLGFLAGCQHVRQSQHCLALERVAEAAKRFVDTNKHGDWLKMREALAALDRASGVGE